MIIGKRLGSRLAKPGTVARKDGGTVGAATRSGSVEDRLTEVYSQLRRYSETEVVGPMARAGLAEIEVLERKRPVIMAIIDEKFPEGSLTFEKYASVVDATVSTIAENSQLLSRRIQMFDIKEYKKIRYLLSSGMYREDDIPDDVQEAKGKLFQKSKDDMNAIISANEKLLLELERFATEIGMLDEGSLEAKVDGIVGEIQQLVGELSYYKENLF